MQIAVRGIRNVGGKRIVRITTTAGDEEFELPSLQALTDRADELLRDNQFYFAVLLALAREANLAPASLVGKACTISMVVA